MSETSVQQMSTFHKSYEINHCHSAGIKSGYRAESHFMYKKQSVITFILAESLLTLSTRISSTICISCVRF